MDRDSKTRTGARALGVERLGPLARRRLTRASSLTQSREYTVNAVGTKDEGKPGWSDAGATGPGTCARPGRRRADPGRVGVRTGPAEPQVRVPDSADRGIGPQWGGNAVYQSAALVSEESFARAQELLQENKIRSRR